MLSKVRGTPQRLPPPAESMDGIWTPQEKAVVESFMGGAATVRRKLKAFAEATADDELMVHAFIYNHAERLRSYEVVAEIVNVSARLSVPLRKNNDKRAPLIEAARNGALSELGQRAPYFPASAPSPRA